MLIVYFNHFFSVTGDNGETIVIRDCALDSGTLTTDTELVRMSHCGGFIFEDRYANGCVQSCHVDACNTSRKSVQVTSIHSFTLMMMVHLIVK